MMGDDLHALVAARRTHEWPTSRGRLFDRLGHELAWRACPPGRVMRGR